MNFKFHKIDKLSDNIHLYELNMIFHERKLYSISINIGINGLMGFRHLNYVIVHRKDDQLN